MNIHEYQGKELLGKFGVPVPKGTICTKPEEVLNAAKPIVAAGGKVVIKSQIHAGGRGKGAFKSGYQGGVKVLGDIQKIEEAARAMLGGVLVTKQTGPEGKEVQKVLVEPATELLKEYYLAVLLDRAISKPIIMASAEGGMDIEEVAEHSPEKILKEVIDPAVGLYGYQARKMASALGFKGELVAAAAKVITGVYRTWWECDASMVEINPMAHVRLADGKETVYAIDAKIGFDDNALYRHPEIQAMRDLSEEAPLEIEASKFNLNYIKLDGNIACLVNGAGLAMSTMDIIQHYGGSPANFLDVGGGASKEQVTAAFRIILSDPNVKAILVNIFGGIMQCDIIASGIVAAVQETGLKLPLVVRLEGNNVEIGKKILRESGLNLISADSMADGAQKVVKSVTGQGK
ncbi:MAG TPA: ADP-forming succinate--CoA ligase subunit beta [Methylomirabilota bacterium]|nr:ADP-forming succinate--CoA ligase subunit beta [Methylomirabilota bacterium]